MVSVGEVWEHLGFYADKETGDPLTKYLLVLAIRPDGDIVFRLLTSQEYNRPNDPACIKSGDRPGFFLGIPQPGGKLWKNTWLDLREIEDDFDALTFERRVNQKQIILTHRFSDAVMCTALSCAAYAEDTTRNQTKHIMNARAALKCPS
jgi:hypothetical protein